MQIRYNAMRNGFWSGFNMKIEPRHDKTNKKICVPSEASDQPEHPPSLVRWMDELGFYIPVFQSFQDDGRVNMKGCVQWSAV